MVQRLRWPNTFVVGLLILIGVSASTSFYFREPYHDGLIRFPIATALHVIPGGAFLALAPLQFNTRLRHRSPALHRWLGRCLVVCGVVTGVNGLVLALAAPFAPGWRQVVFGCFGALFLLALAQGFRHIRAGRVQQHREWMIRAFALGLAVATQRLILIPLIIILNIQSPAEAAPLAAPTFALALLINTAAAELWLRASRRHERRIAASAEPRLG